MPARSRLLCLPCATLFALGSACIDPSTNTDEVGEDTTSDSDSATSTDETSTVDTTDTDSTGEAPDCGGFLIVPTFVRSEVMLVVDASSSMALETWDHDGDPLTPEVTRWATARAFIESVLTELDGSMNFGVQRFPSANACPDATPMSGNCSDADACLLGESPEVGVGEAQAPLILDSLPTAAADSIEIVGGSPASAGITAAHDHLLAQLRAAPRAMVLVTDGGANCGVGLSLPASFETYDDLLPMAVGKAYQFDGIPTLVVGVDVDSIADSPGEDSPDVDAFAALNEVALEGGMPWQGGMNERKFFDVRDPRAVIDALGPVDGVLDCVLDLTTVPDGPPAPSQIPLLTIEFERMPVPLVEDCENANGWAWIVEGEILSFCGSYCELFKDGAGAFEGDYGCPAET